MQGAAEDTAAWDNTPGAEARARKAADAAYSVVEPVLEKLLEASRKHRFLPDLDLALLELEDLLKNR